MNDALWRALGGILSFAPPGEGRAVGSEPLRILRVGDSITRMCATEPSLAQRLRAGGVACEFVGSQRPPGGVAELDTRCEGFDGKPLAFFTSEQRNYGHETVWPDGRPLERALRDTRPHLLLAMVGVNNLGNTQADQIDAAKLRGEFDRFLDAAETHGPAGMRLLIATVPPANDAKAAPSGGLHRNLRHALFNEQVVRPAVRERLAAGKLYRLVDVFDAMTPADIYDLVHPCAEGRRKINEHWAEAILSVVRK